MTNLTDIIRKIKALRARAADDASSENEAAKAAAVAEKLIREHNIDLSELDVRAEGVEKNVWGAGKRTRTAPCFAAVRIGKANNCDVWVQNGGEVCFLGNPADVEVCLYFMDLVANAAEACLRQFRKTAEYSVQSGYWSPRKVSEDYRVGVCQRLGERIRDQYQAAEPTATGAGLVVVKNSLIEQWKRDNGLTLRSKNNRSRQVSSAYGTGRDAADNVSIGRGIGTQRTTQRALV